MPPVTTDILRENEARFARRWKFPNCVGCIDGKHVRIKKPANSGSEFFNYKQHFSLILQAIADENCRFTSIEVGANGKASDGGVFQVSDIYRRIEGGVMPPDKPLPGSTFAVPHVLLGDQGYPLKPYLLRPYNRQNASPDEETFNKKLSSVRRVVECAFGILVAKWRVLKTEIQCTPENVETMVKCMCILHNIIIDKDGPAETAHYLHSPDHLNTLLEHWTPLNIGRSQNRYSQSAWSIRERFKNYLTR
ncbi:hypothetical protein M8J75_012631 [Diaphorina citri]|nr:hypothetical protein M8J75_012631 [Diaphorina citri]